MRSLVRRILAAIEIARLSVAFGAVANVWLMILLAHGDERLAELPGDYAAVADYVAAHAVPRG